MYKREGIVYQPAYNEKDLCMLGYCKKIYRDGLWTFWRNQDDLIKRYPRCVPLPYNLDDEIFDDCEPTIIE